MLNRVIEKGQVKCHQYWPARPGEVLDLPDVNLKLENTDEVPGSDYTVRTLKLTHTELEESRKILHFHYTTWPDFGVPQSPEAFSKFLNVVIKSGCLEPNVGPPVVHCSAGIGRTGSACFRPWLADSNSVSRQCGLLSVCRTSEICR